MAVWAIFNGIDCHKCNKQLQVLRGCEKDVSPMTVEDIRLTRCPMNYITEVERTYLSAYFQYEKGYLPNPGGWLDQPCKFTAVMAIVDNLVNKFKTEREEKWQRKT